MATTIHTPPPDMAYSKNPIWVTLETDATVSDPASIEMVISEPGPTEDQYLTLQWAGNDLTFIVEAYTGNGLQLPRRSDAGTLAEYATLFADQLRQNEIIDDYFIVSATGGTVLLTQRVLQIVDITTATDMSNVSVVATDVAEVTANDNLRALLQVVTDTGDFSTDERLISLHAPYNYDTLQAVFDIRAAFAHLAPHLPDAATIAPTVAPTDLITGDATSHYQRYYLRHADKYGSPAVAEALQRTESSYYAILGGLAGDAIQTGAGISVIRHNYNRRDGKVFRKPVGEFQPDWIYYMPTEGIDMFVSILVEWSDGTQSVYRPFDPDTVTLQANHIYWIPCGFRQMKLHTLAPSGGTAADAYITGYQWRIGPLNDSLNWQAIVYFSVLYDTPWLHYLLFENGAGGMETVWLRGKAQESYQAAADEVQRPQRPGHTVAKGDFTALAAGGRPVWEMNTGWYDDPYYLQHLRQLPLAQAWLVDASNQRFQKVIVEARELRDLVVDDQVLYGIQFNIKAGWIDPAHNG